MNGDIKSRALMTNDDLINWLGVLGKGYVKPDTPVKPSANTTGVVWETKFYMPFIMAINAELCERAGVVCPDISEFRDFK